MEAWYCIQTKARSEAIAEIALMRQGYNTYFPQCIVDKRRSVTRLVEPLFPRYGFVQLVAGEDDFHPITKTHGVVAMVRFGLWPATVPDSLIQALKIHEDSVGIHAIPKFDYSIGDQVTIRGGVFDQYTAIVEAKKSDRIIVLLDIVSQIAGGMQARIQVSYRDLQPTG